MSSHSNQLWDLKSKDTRGRPMSLETKLGRYLSKHQYRAAAVAMACGFSTRLMTEYISGRRVMTQEHLLKLCRLLEITPDQIVEDVDDDYEDEITTLTDSSRTTPGANTTSKVSDLARQHKQRLKGEG